MFLPRLDCRFQRLPDKPLMRHTAIIENIVGRFHQPSPDLAAYPSLASGNRKRFQKGFCSAFLNNYPV